PSIRSGAIAARAFRYASGGTGVLPSQTALGILLCLSRQLSTSAIVRSNWLQSVVIGSTNPGTRPVGPSGVGRSLRLATSSCRRATAVFSKAKISLADSVKSEHFLNVTSLVTL